EGQPGVLSADRLVGEQRAGTLEPPVRHSRLAAVRVVVHGDFDRGPRGPSLVGRGEGFAMRSLECRVTHLEVVEASCGGREALPGCGHARVAEGCALEGLPRIWPAAEAQVLPPLVDQGRNVDRARRADKPAHGSVVPEALILTGYD